MSEPNAGPSENGRENVPAPAEEPLPERLPILPLSEMVFFPSLLVPMSIRDRPAAKIVTEALRTDKQLLLLTVRPGRNAAETNPADPPFFRVGTHGVIVQMIKLPDASVRLLLQGRRRLRVREFTCDDGRWYGVVERFEEEAGDRARIDALQRKVLALFQEIAARTPGIGAEVGELLQEIGSAGQLADVIGANLNLEVERKQALLEEPSVARRLDVIAGLLGKERQALEYGQELEGKLKSELEKAQRELWLREQLRVIQEELGEGEQGDVAELRRRLESAGLPESAREHAERELRRLERTMPQAPEYHVIRTYVEWLASLPWSAESPEEIDLERAREILDRDHYDLDEVKERIIEHLAVRKLNPEQRGPILCFVGPPGVGKTSLGRSIAEALGRKFVRASLGGVRDEAEIRGHRRTYVGALPGRIIRGLRDAGVRNPVFMLDEIDKIGQDFRGDPSAALLEALDPAQNHGFSDHYLEVSFDLSRVMFIATANSLATVPPALRDRLEVLELAGYTSQEKFEIGQRYLIPRQVEAAGLSPERVCITDAALRRLIAEYTREAGVRELERQIARIMRKVALRLVEDEGTGWVRVSWRNLPDYAGKRRYESEVAGRADEIGTAIALAYTPMGGEILFVEAVRMPGQGKIHLTGHLGGVMKESARTALSYVRANAARLGVPDDTFQGVDVHVHVPAGATPKDGPSAGVALVVALASLFTGRSVRHDVAMTGEVTLRGHVLPVGGIKEKLVAASQAGIRTVLVPRRNEADLEDLPPEVAGTMEFILMDDVADAIGRALVSDPAGGEEDARPPERAAS
ncbi:MAG TPA: endopeptidase La [Longimicrobiales bacterium]|nr:endopeptidase La [Longimicrobiales bacterium]